MKAISKVIVSLVQVKKLKRIANWLQIGIRSIT